MVADIPPLLILGSGDGVVRALHGKDGTVRWEYPLGFPLLGPKLAIAPGVVYVAAGFGHVYALDLDDGHLLWQRHLAPLPERPRLDEGARIVAGGGIVAINFARGDRPPPCERYITALDGRDGTERWVAGLPLSAVLRHYVRLPGRLPWRVGVSLLGADDHHVYATISVARAGARPDWEQTVALDTRHGRRRWGTWRAAAHHWLNLGNRTPLGVADDAVYTVGTRVSGLAARSGRRRWQRPTPSLNHRRMLAAGHEVVCVAGGDVFVAYRARDGERLWQMETGGEPPSLHGMESLVLMEPTVYIGGIADGRRSDDSFGIVARDTLTGAARWEWPAPDQTERLVRVDLSWRFVGADGFLYVPGPKTTSAIRASDGQHLWTRSGPGGIPALIAVPGTRTR